MLKYNELEFGWECSECGALYSAEEAARVFDYNTTDLEEQKERAKRKLFTPCYCMDCGILWDNVE